MMKNIHFTIFVECVWIYTYCKRRMFGKHVLEVKKKTIQSFWKGGVLQTTAYRIDRSCTLQQHTKINTHTHTHTHTIHIPKRFCVVGFKAKSINFGFFLTSIKYFRLICCLVLLVVFSKNIVMVLKSLPHCLKAL